MDSKLNKNVVQAANNPNIFLRMEDCVLNAKTDLAKRRLVQATVTLSMYAHQVYA